MNNDRMLRVSKRNPCPVCGRCGWCGTSADGSICICMRIAKGARKQTANGGYLHILRDDPAWRNRPPVRVVHIEPPSPRRPELDELAERCRQAVEPAALDALASSLGLTTPSLRRLQVGWSAEAHAWSFPMQDLAGNVLGIRLRTLSGKKFAVRGGREGLFIPDGLAFSTDLLVSEGPTDTAALLDLGFEAIGRPCSSGGTRLIIALVKARKPPAIVIVADVDANGVGQRGAEALASSLVPYHASVRTIFPPNNSKDARGWKQAGATPADVQAAVDAAPERSLRVERRII